MTATVEQSTPVEAAHARVEQQLTKADGKAGIVATAATAAIAVFSAVGAATHGGVRAGFVAAAVVAFAALGATLAALWPRLGGDHGFVRWARLTPEQLAGELGVSAAFTEADVIWASKAGVRKNRAVQASIVLLFAAPLAGVLTAVVA